MKSQSAGTGLIALSVVILGSTLIMRFGPAEKVAHAAPPMESTEAIASASTVQVTLTIVWYGIAHNQGLPNYGIWPYSIVA